MTHTNSRVVSVAVVLLAIPAAGLLSTGGLAMSASAGPDAALATAEKSNITMTQRLELTPDQPGEIEVTLAVSIPDRVEAVGLRIPASATVTGREGFAPDSGDRFDWTGDTARPTITFDLPVNETIRGRGPELGTGTYLFVDAGTWALVQPPRPGIRWQWSGQRVQVDRRLVVPGEGQAGATIAFLGPASVRTRRAHGQRFDLVVPDRASLQASPKRILDALANASTELQVGDRDRRVFVVAAPTGVDWGVLGLQTGDSDMWVRASQPLAAASNTWLHEYVHTRQRLNTTASSRWVVEGTATYYGAFLALKADLISFAAFERQLQYGTRSRYDDVVLSDPSTWLYRAQYDKGGLVAGAIDRKIRLASNRSRNLQTVFRRLNRQNGPFGHATVREQVGDAGNGSTAAAADRLVTTTATPEMWTRDEHRAAFGPAPAKFTYAVETGPARFRIGGRFRNESLRSLPTLVAGETLTIPVTVTNVGGQSGTYNVSLSVDGTATARGTGALEAGNSTVVNLSTAFGQPGTYRIATGGLVRTVTVVEPATIAVSDVTANRTTLKGSGRVSLTATVRNDESIPAAGTVTFTRNESAVATHNVTLAPGASGTVTATVELSEPGRHVLGGNERTLVVTVESKATPTVTQTATPIPSVATTAAQTATGSTPAGAATTSASGPGFTAWEMLLASLLLTALAWHRSLQGRA